MATLSAAIGEPATVTAFLHRWAKAWNDHDGDAVRFPQAAQTRGAKGFGERHGGKHVAGGA